MKKLIKFPSIEQFRTVVANINRRYNFIGLDENGDAIYDYTLPKPTITFKGTVKVHGCFEKNTPITLANGEIVPISEINIGDNVLSYDFKTSEIITSEVIHTENQKTDKKWIKLTFDNGSILECTEDHKIFTKNRGWVEAKDLTDSDIFLEN